MSSESTMQRSRGILPSYCLLVIIALTAMGSAAPSSCAENQSHRGSTPPQWHIGSTWAVSVFAANHKLIGSMVIRLTGKKALSCMVGDWKQVEILKRQFKDHDLLATKPLSYSVNGDELALGVTEICDGYVFLHGLLTDQGATGDYGTLGLEGFSRLGSFAAVMARD